MTNINEELFKRYAPKKKLEIINSLNSSELSNVTPATITRIVKEAGTNFWKSRNKRLFINRDQRQGNSWNSEIEAIMLIKGKLVLNVYVQYDNTDINIDYPLDSFLRHRESRMEVPDSDRYGNPRTYYAIYNETDKQKVIKSILLQYVLSKYADKLDVKKNK